MGKHSLAAKIAYHNIYSLGEIYHLNVEHKTRTCLMFFNEFSSIIRQYYPENELSLHPSHTIKDLLEFCF